MSHSDGHLTPLFSPRSLVIVGASRQAGKLGYTLLANALTSGFAGSIHAINPHGGEVLGKPLLKDWSTCPRGVDLAVLAVPAPLILAQARQALSRGCAALVVVADGFREMNEEGGQREAALAKLCRERGALLLGPNSLGVIHRQHGLNTSLTLTTPPTGGVSLLSQSGAMCAAALDWMAARHLGLAKMISLGNEAGINDAQCMSYLAQDPHTKVIACYLEWVTDGAGFLRAATEASRSKPVVMLLGGSSEWRKRSAIRHSGFLPHSPAVFAAACDRTGVIQTKDFQSWLDTLLALARAPLPAGNGVAIVTNGGGPGVLTSDMLDRHGLVSTGLAEALAHPLKSLLPARASLSGPLDLCGVAQPHHYQATVEAALTDDGIDALLALVTPQALTRPLEIVQSLPVTPAKPLLTVLMGGRQMRAGMETLDQLGMASYPTPERAAMALSALEQYGRWRQRGPRIISQFAVNRSRVRRLLQRCAVLGIHRLCDLETKEALQAYGIPIPEGEEAATVDEALELADRMGYPVALHLLSPERHLAQDMAIRHGDITSPQGLRDGFDLLTLRFAKHVPAGRLEGVFVEKSLSLGRAVRLTMTRDVQFGPLLQVESSEPVAPDESNCQLAPITSDEALAMLRVNCRQHPTTELCHDVSEADLLAVAEVLQRLGQLAVDFPEISQITIHSLTMRRAGLPPLVSECSLELHQERLS